MSTCLRALYPSVTANTCFQYNDLFTRATDFVLRHAISRSMFCVVYLYMQEKC